MEQSKQGHEEQASVGAAVGDPLGGFRGRERVHGGRVRAVASRQPETPAPPNFLKSVGGGVAALHEDPRRCAMIEGGCIMRARRRSVGALPSVGCRALC